MFKLSKYRGVIFHDIESDTKFEEQLTRGLKNDMKNLVNFGQSIRMEWDAFIQSKKYMSLKFTKELCVMTMEND